MPVQTQYSVAPQAAFAGMLADDSENDAITMNNQGAASMPFGAAVVYKSSSPATDKDASLPTANTDVFVGVLIHSHDFERSFNLPDGTLVGELDSIGVVVGGEIAVLTKGTIWVKVVTAVTAGAQAHYSNAVSGAYTAVGQWGATGIGGSTVALNARFSSSAAAGGYAKLRIGASTQTAD